MYANEITIVTFGGWDESYHQIPIGTNSYKVWLKNPPQIGQPEKKTTKNKSSSKKTKSKRKSSSEWKEAGQSEFIVVEDKK
jgi:hypothetical protein